MKRIIISVLFILPVPIAVLFFLLYRGDIQINHPDRDRYGVIGLDVSHHQGKIEWAEVPREYRFVYAKATEGVTFTDRSFRRNRDEVKKTGRAFGAYHFYLFGYSGEEQARHFIRTAGATDLPPVLDVEFSGNPHDIDVDRERAEIAKCIALLESHYRRRVILYVTDDSYDRLISGRFTNPVWYRSVYTPVLRSIPYMIIWQYGNRGKVRGIKGPVDLDAFAGDEKELRGIIPSPI